MNQRDQGWTGEHPHDRGAAQLAAAAVKSFDQLLDEHVEDYRALFDRVVLDVGQSPDATLALPTDERLAAYRDGAEDPDLEELLFHNFPLGLLVFVRLGK